MQWMIVYCNWKAAWWLGQAKELQDLSPMVQQGVAAYTVKQAAVYIRLAKYFRQIWHPALISNNVEVEWPLEYQGQWFIVYHII